MTAILPQSFFILSCVGLWRPVEWQGWKCILYNSYSCFIVLNNIVFTVTEFLDLILASTTINEFTNDLAKMLGQVGAFGKIVGVLCNHRMIAYVVQLLNQKPFILLDLYENDIKKKYISIYSFVIRFYFMFFTVGVTGVLFTQISMTEFLNVLPYKGWFPYNYSRPNIFISTAAHQLFTFFIGAYIHVAFDTLFLGMMLYVSIQINVLQYRFQYIVKTIVKFNVVNQNGDEGNSHDKKLIAEWVDHHNDVLSLSDYVHRTFSGSIFFQYCLSSTQICVTVYALSSISVFSIEFISGIIFLLGTTLQIFVLCIAAHQVTLET
ncbi:odorant receptor Or1-like isoform X2 [Microplitis mediator]|uniref:odorant receptor Or1-like isoform X2 n=1 Tax=Microplitis mediator TaxID=375433 RepID=UPI0025560962|nr:odorant receptor Or1-like isoform X2 [Microplitis mediator]